jgi:hypothetical protein
VHVKTYFYAFHKGVWVEVQRHSFLTTLYGKGKLYASAALTLRKNLPVPTEEESGWGRTAGMDSTLKKTILCPCQEWLLVVQSQSSHYTDYVPRANSTFSRTRTNSQDIRCNTTIRRENKPHFTGTSTPVQSEVLTQLLKNSTSDLKYSWRTDSVKHSLSWEADSYSASQKKFPGFYKPLRFIIVFTTARYLWLSWARWDHSMTSYHNYLRYALILFSHIRLCLLSFYVSPLNRCMRYPSPDLILTDRIIWIILGEKYELWGSSLCICLQPPVTSSLLESNIFLSTLFSNTISLRCYLQVRDQVWYP